jgi:uncharacterized protein
MDADDARIDLDELRRSVSRVLDDEPRVSFCYLFGSAATTSTRADSDVDLAVALGTPMSLMEEARLHERLARAVGTETDLVVLSHAPLWLRFRILGEGVVLYSRDEAARIRFRERTEHAYLDMRPYREEYLAAVRARARSGALTRG